MRNILNVVCSSVVLCLVACNSATNVLDASLIPEDASTRYVVCIDDEKRLEYLNEVMQVTQSIKKMYWSLGDINSDVMIHKFVDEQLDAVLSEHSIYPPDMDDFFSMQYLKSIVDERIEDTMDSWSVLQIINTCDIEKGEFVQELANYLYEELQTAYSYACYTIISEMLWNLRKGEYDDINDIIELVSNEQQMLGELSDKDILFIANVDIIFSICNNEIIEYQEGVNGLWMEVSAEDCFTDLTNSLEEIIARATTDAVLIGVGFAATSLGTAGAGAPIAAIGGALSALVVTTRLMYDVNKAYKVYYSCLETAEVLILDEEQWNYNWHLQERWDFKEWQNITYEAELCQALHKMILP